MPRFNCVECKADEGEKPIYFVTTEALESHLRRIHLDHLPWVCVRCPGGRDRHALERQLIDHYLQEKQYEVSGIEWNWVLMKGVDPRFSAPSPTPPRPWSAECRSWWRRDERKRSWRTRPAPVPPTTPLRWM
jgi:hypothetical protein